MHPLAVLTAVDIPSEIAGQSLRLFPLRLIDLAELGQRFESSNAPKIPQQPWHTTDDGIAHALYLMLRRCDPSITVAAVSALLAAAPDQLPAIRAALTASLPPSPTPSRTTSENPPPDWSKIFRELAGRYGWTPQQIAELTPGQVRHFLPPSSPPPTAQPIFPSHAAAFEYLARRHANR